MSLLVLPRRLSSASSIGGRPSSLLHRHWRHHRHHASAASSNRPPLPQSYEHDTLLTNKRVLIANRGEIAIRIARAARSLGATSVAICAPEDISSPHVTYADEHVVLEKGNTAIGPYLNIQELTKICIDKNVDYVHPGYGFLSESAPFAQSLVNAGITWVGPSPDVLALFGDKIQARSLAQQSNVPVVRGSDNLVSGDECMAVLNNGSVRLPAIMKAAYGGGGRGMRIVREMSDVHALFDSCQREAMTAFGRDEVFLEEYWDNTKHLEVQILGDGCGGVVHLFERDVQYNTDIKRSLNWPQHGIFIQNYVTGL